MKHLTEYDGITTSDTRPRKTLKTMGKIDDLVMMINSLDIDFIHGDIHGRSCKNIQLFPICHLHFCFGSDVCAWS